MLTNTSEENVPDLNIVLLSTDVMPMSIVPFGVLSFIMINSS